MKTIYNTGCLHHLYFIEKKDNKTYEAKCLFCEQTHKFKNNNEILNSKIIFSNNGIFRQQIYKDHKIDYNYETIKEIIYKLLSNDITMSNEMLINELELLLYSLDLSSCIISKKKNNNPLLLIYYKQKIENIKEKIQTLTLYKDEVQKKKIKA